MYYFCRFTIQKEVIIILNGESNSRIVVQCGNEEILNTIVEHIKERFSGRIVFATDVRANTRPPHLNGVHQILHLSLEAVDIE